MSNKDLGINHWLIFDFNQTLFNNSHGISPYTVIQMYKNTFKNT